MAVQGTDWEEGLLRSLVGEQLSSVEFVQDYVQFHFDGPRVSAITHPVVEVGREVLAWNAPGFRDALCDRIGREVAECEIVPHDRLTIGFADGAKIVISLKPEDYQTDEAVTFQDGELWWVL